MAHFDRFNNKGFGSDLPYCNTDTTYVVSSDDDTLDMVVKISRAMYTANPSLIFQAFETGGTFDSLDLSNSDKRSIIKSMCDAQNFSGETLSAINALSVLKGFGVSHHG